MFPISYIMHLETAVTVLHSTHNSTQMTTLQNYYIPFCHQHNMIIKEQTQKQKIPVFELTCDVQLITLADLWILEFSLERFIVHFLS